MIDLFVLEQCPYCKKVMCYMDENGIKYNKIDISDKASEAALIQMGGKRQVPFMVDKDRNIQMYESNDIIEYVKTLK
ncbi:MAG: glutathione S-transferase N-terminal domain-containing protein [Candidatus Gastranaerophilales bacterium]|nr:glutathione S-transferase N-terminal domain-containing protein [Candidatus Gastranaerophilales bacterium]MCM1072746.1 glutathione S-transferase N-terminal domain-containing protein [Bacteroides sp.]